MKFYRGKNQFIKLHITLSFPCQKNDEKVETLTPNPIPDHSIRKKELKQPAEKGYAVDPEELTKMHYERRNFDRKL